MSLHSLDDWLKAHGRHRTISVPTFPDTKATSSSSLSTYHFVDFDPCVYRSEIPDDLHTIVLVHGWPEYWYGWRKVIPGLVDSGYRVVAVDNRGFGDSVVATEHSTDIRAYTFAAACQDMTHMLDYLRIRKAVFCGHDWGGMVVARMALLYPGRCSAICSICTPYRPRTRKFVPIQAIAKANPAFAYQVFFQKDQGVHATRLLNHDIHETFCFYLRSYDEILHSKPKDSAIARSRLLTEHELQQYVDTYSKRGFRTTVYWYSTDKLNWEQAKNLPTKMIHPFLMINPEDDHVLSPNLSQGMEKWTPNLSRVRISNAAHWVNAEQPFKVVAAITRWLGETATVMSKTGSTTSQTIPSKL
jgi:pimeloyl-ACP methyl ester carboxylesterase